MLYAIGDLHLSIATNKSMEIFGGAWEDYLEKIVQGFSSLNAEDVCVICGDTSWAMNLDEAAADFHFLDQLPGQKIILKGNHDYWWSSASKIEAFFEKEHIGSIRLLHNNCWYYGDTAICGTRGWFYEEESGTAHDLKILSRELIRLEASLKCAGDTKKICFLHYPPRYHNYVCSEIVSLFDRYGVSDCCYGHIHGHSQKNAVTGKVGGVFYHNVSADHIGFRPELLLD